MKFIAWIFVFFVLALSFPFGVFAERPESQPNIIIFYVDDMGYADPSCFGTRTWRRHISIGSPAKA